MAKQVRTLGGSGARNSHVRFHSKQEARSLLDRRARRLLGISGEEFLRRLDQGELAGTPGESALAVFAELAR